MGAIKSQHFKCLCPVVSSHLSWVLSASLKIKGLFRSLFAKTLLRSKTTDSYTEPITTFWLLHLLLFWRLFPQIIIPCGVPFFSFYSASEALTLHVITTSGLSTFGLWCPCAWEDSSTSGQPGGPLPSLWGLGQRGVCFRGQRPGARMKAAALNTSVPCFRTKWKRENGKVLLTEQNGCPEPHECVNRYCLQTVLWASGCLGTLLYPWYKVHVEVGDSFFFFLFFSLLFHSHPPSFKGSSLLTVLSLFPQYQNIWSHQAGFRLWCWHFLMPTSREHLISVNEQIKGTVAWSN